MPYPNEWSCRLRDPASVKVVGSKNRSHNGKTYRVLFGIPKGGDGSVEQAYRYPKSSWSRSEAASHCKSHQGRFDAAAEEESMELVFKASVLRLDAQDDQRTATFYLMNTSRNRNRWGVTDKSLNQALPTLKDTVLGAGPEYKIDQHYPEALEMGRFIRGEKPDGYALGTAQITDDTAWQKLEAKEWGPVSVIIKCYHERCSACDEELTGAENPFTHDCVKTMKGYVQIHSFKFERVDFIEDPAYPQAGVTDLAALTQDPEAPLILCAGVYENQTYQSPNHGQGAGAPGTNTQSPAVSNTSKQGKSTMSDELTQLQSQVTALKGEKKTLEDKVTTLIAELKQIKDQRHTELLEDAVNARFEAKLSKDKDKDRDALAKFPDEVLVQMAHDALTLLAQMKPADKPAPKTRYTQADSDNFTTACREMRASLGLSPKEDVYRWQ